MKLIELFADDCVEACFSKRKLGNDSLHTSRSIVSTLIVRAIKKWEKEKWEVLKDLK